MTYSTGARCAKAPAIMTTGGPVVSACSASICSAVLVTSLRPAAVKGAAIERRISPRPGCNHIAPLASISTRYTIDGRAPPTVRCAVTGGPCGASVGGGCAAAPGRAAPTSDRCVGPLGATSSRGVASRERPTAAARCKLSPVAGGSPTPGVDAAPKVCCSTPRGRSAPCCVTELCRFTSAPPASQTRRPARGTPVRPRPTRGAPPWHTLRRRR